MPCHAMQCILYKIYFWKVFHMYYKLIYILCAVLCGQNFILVKSGCYRQKGGFSGRLASDGITTRGYGALPLQSVQLSG
jgi:hypothetical protein